jgi:hypothetical protein
LLVLLPLQLLGEPVDLELLRGQSIFQSLDIRSRDCGRCWCGGGSVFGGWSGRCWGFCPGARRQSRKRKSRDE